MNASAEKSHPRAVQTRRRRSAILALSMLSVGGVSACADIRRATSLPPVNPESPVAGVVAAATFKNYKRPTFASVPPEPLNIPPADTVKIAVVDMVRCRRAYDAWVMSHPPLVSGTRDVAEDLRARLDNNPVDVPNPAGEAVTAGDAAKLRAYADPPPPIRSGPAPTSAEAVPPGGVVAGAAPPHPRAVPAAAPVKAAARSPAAPPPPGAVADPGLRAPSASEIQIAAVAQPPMTPAYADPLLAHCR